MKKKLDERIPFLQGTRVLFLFLMTVSLLSVSVGSAFAGVPPDQSPIPFSQLSFRGNVVDISGWPATKALHSVGIEGENLYMPNDAACSWRSPDGFVNANVHIVLQYKGEWIASPWDYMGICQVSKHYGAIGDIPYMGWKPQKGVAYYFFLTGISRDPSGTVQERTNVVKYVWFGPTGYPPPACSGAPVIKSFTVVPGTVSKGKAATMAWNISGADGITITNEKGEKVAFDKWDPQTGSTTIYPLETTTLTLTATNSCLDGAAPPSKSVKINVVSSLSFMSSLLLYISPNVTTGAATNNGTGSTATLTGTINANNNNKSYDSVFEYGLDSTYGSTAAGNPPTVSGLSDTDIEADVLGLTKDTQYHYRLSAVSGTRVESGVDAVFTTPTDPVAVTELASNVADVAATLNGHVNPGRSDTIVTFEYTQKVGGVYSSTPMIATASQSPLSGDTSQLVSANVAGLTSLAMYRFRVKAVSDVATVDGAYQEFTTHDKPDLTTFPASSVTETGAQLSGEVNPNGAATVVTFLWSESSVSPGYDNTVVQSLPAGVTPVPVGTDLTGLTAGTLYKFKIEAVNTYGSVTTPVGLEFTTDSAPVAVTGGITNVGATSVTLNGTVTANGAVTTVSCEWGGSTGVYLQSIPAIESPLAADAADLSPVTCNFTGLSAGITYYYIVRANNGIGGDVDGSEMSFTFAPPS